MLLQDKIKAERIGLKLSQEELAESIYVSRVSISNWETGKTFPDIDSLILLSKIFNVSVDYLVAFEASKIKVEHDVYEYGKLQGMYRICVLAIITTLMPLLYYTQKYGYKATILLFMIPTTFLLISIYIEREMKKYDIDKPLELYNFLKGSSLEEIRAMRLKPNGRFMNLKIFLAGLIVSIGLQAIVGLFV